MNFDGIITCTDNIIQYIFKWPLATRSPYQLVFTYQTWLFIIHLLYHSKIVNFDVVVAVAAFFCLNPYSFRMHPIGCIFRCEQHELIRFSHHHHHHQPIIITYTQWICMHNSHARSHNISIYWLQLICESAWILLMNIQPRHDREFQRENNINRNNRSNSKEKKITFRVVINIQTKWLDGIESWNCKPDKHELNRTFRQRKYSDDFAIISMNSIYLRKCHSFIDFTTLCMYLRFFFLSFDYMLMLHYWHSICVSYAISIKENISEEVAKSNTFRFSNFQKTHIATAINSNSSNASLLSLR